MSRLLLMGLLGAMMSGVWTTEAIAQRDAGAKARGEVGTGFWNPMYRRSRSGSYSFRPARPRAESYRSFSYQPTEINPGDTVVVKDDAVKIMDGTNVVGTVPNGLQFKVNKVLNGWLGTVVDVDGQALKGWIRRGNVELAEKAASKLPEATCENTQVSNYRSFSYEPSRSGVPLFRGSSARQSSSRERTKPPWAYLKTDPRRHQN